jgi:hypothetical protein
MCMYVEVVQIGPFLCFQRRPVPIQTGKQSQ